jgi:hypothetical protein
MIPREIDNDECRAALLSIQAAGQMPLDAVLRGKDELFKAIVKALS